MRLQFRSPVYKSIDLKEALELINSSITCEGYRLWAMPNQGLDGQMKSIQLYASHPVIDSLDPEGKRETTVTNSLELPLKGLSRDEVIKGAYHCIQNLVLHEVDEWFKVGDEKPFYPHKPESVGGKYHA
jgi:hypothetical protein